MNIILRRVRLDDAKSICKYANNNKIADNVRNSFPHPYSMKDAQNFIGFWMKDNELRQCNRVIVIDGEVVGCIGLFLQEDVSCKTAELGYWLGEPFWRKGIATKSIEMLCKYAFDNYDIERIYAITFVHNVGSRRALEKCGFLLEGIMKKSIYKNGKTYDSCMYALLQ